MANFVQLLNDKYGAEDVAAFKVHLDALDPLDLSKMIHGGRGPISMTKASGWWVTIAANFNKWVKELSDNVCKPLATQCLGASTEEIISALEELQQWMTKMETATNATSLLLQQVVEAFKAARERVVPPRDIEENRAQVKLLIARGFAEIYVDDIIALDMEHRQWKEENVTVVMEYYRAAEKAATELPPFPQPPAPAFARISWVKRANH